MRVVIADTGPINYLILIDCIHIFPRLFTHVVLPAAVVRELSDRNAPHSVRAWIGAPPDWVEIYRRQDDSRLLPGLGSGESEAIRLSEELQPGVLLMDDRRGAAAAAARGLRVAGTLGILARAADAGIIDLAAAFSSLTETNFRYQQRMLDALLKRSGA